MEEPWKETLCKTLALDPATYLPLFGNINEEFWDKLALHLTEEQDKLRQSQALSVSLEKSFIKVEEHVHGLEKTYLDTKRQLTNLQKAHEDLHLRYTLLEKDRSSHSAAKESIQASHSHHQSLEVDNLISETKALKKSLEVSDSENRDLLQLLQKKSSDIESLNERIDEQSNRIKSLKDEKLDLEKSLSEEQGKNSIHLINKVTLEKELENIKKHNAWLQTEYDAKVQEYQAYRTKCSSENVELKVSLESLQNEHSVTLKMHTDLKASHEELFNALESLKSEEKNLKIELAEKEENFKLEIGSQKHLIELMEQSLQEQLKFNENYEKIIAELEEASHRKDKELALLESQARDQQLLQLSNISTPLALQSKVPQIPEDKVESKSLEDMPATPNFADKLKSAGAVSVTEMYSEYSGLKAQINRLTAENARLNEVVDGLWRDAEKSSHKVELGKKEVERIKKDADVLSRELDKATSERNALRQKVQKLDGDNNRLKIENKSLAQGTADLGRQIQQLLRTIEGGQDASQAISDDSTGIFGAEKLISERLVPFSNIKELQERNQELLRVVRALSFEKEQAEKDLADAADRSLKNALEPYYKELEDLKEARLRQQNLMESLVKQRDMYKELAAKHGENDVKAGEQPVEQPMAASPFIDDSSLNFKYNSLLSEYETYKREKQEIDRQYNSQIEELRRESSNLRIKFSKAETENSFINDKLSIATKNFESQKKDLENCRNNNAKLMNSLLDHQKQIEEKVQSLMTEKENCMKLNIMNASLKSENESLKESNQKLTTELSFSHVEKRRIEDLMISLQKIQNEFEHSQTESKRRLEGQIEFYEKEANTLREKLSEERDNNKIFTIRHENEVKELKTRAEKLAEDLASALDDASTKALKIEDLMSSNKELAEKLKSTENKLNAMLAEESFVASELTREKQLELDLREARSEILTMKDELEQALRDSENYKAIAAASESSLSELSSTFDSYKISHQKEFEVLHNENKSQAAEVVLLQENNQKLSEELENAKSSLQASQSQWQSEKDSFMEKIKQLSSVEAEFLAKEASMKKIVDEQVALSAEAHSNYERELLMHASDLQALNDMKEKFLKLQEKYSANELDLRESTEKMNLLKDEWNRAKETLNSKSEESEKRVDELKKQNEMLLSQLENLSSQTQRIHDFESQISSTGENSTSDKKYQELVEIVRFVRREKDILQCQYDLLDHELKQTQSKCEHLQKALDDCKSSLKQEQEKSAGFVESEESFKELIEKVNQVNILRESNVTLRRENQININKVKSLEGDLKAEREKISPLEERNRSQESELKALREELKLFENDNKKWKERVDKLLAKYDRIDPIEYKKALEEKEEAVNALEQLKVKYEEDVSRERKSGMAYKSKCEEFLKKIREALQEKKRLEAQILELQAKTRGLETQVLELQAKSSEKSNTVLTEKKLLESELNYLRSNHEKMVVEKQAEIEQVKAQGKAVAIQLSETQQLLNNSKQLLEDMTGKYEKAKEIGVRMKDANFKLLNQAKLKEAELVSTKEEFNRLKELATRLKARFERNNVSPTTMVNSNSRTEEQPEPQQSSQQQQSQQSQQHQSQQQNQQQQNQQQQSQQQKQQPQQQQLALTSEPVSQPPQQQILKRARAEESPKSKSPVRKVEVGEKEMELEASVKKAKVIKSEEEVGGSGRQDMPNIEAIAKETLIPPVVPQDDDNGNDTPVEMNDVKQENFDVEDEDDDDEDNVDNDEVDVEENVEDNDVEDDQVEAQDASQDEEINDRIAEEEENFLVNEIEDEEEDSLEESTKESTSPKVFQEEINIVDDDDDDESIKKKGASLDTNNSSIEIIDDDDDDDEEEEEEEAEDQQDEQSNEDQGDEQGHEDQGDETFQAEKVTVGEDLDLEMETEAEAEAEAESLNQDPKPQSLQENNASAGVKVEVESEANNPVPPKKPKFTPIEPPSPITPPKVITPTAGVPSGSSTMTTSASTRGTGGRGMPRRNRGGNRGGGRGGAGFRGGRGGSKPLSKPNQSSQQTTSNSNSSNNNSSNSSSNNNSNNNSKKQQ